MTLSFVAALAIALPGGGESVANFGPKPIPKWNISAPAEYWLPVNGGVNVAHAGGERFIAQPEGARPRMPKATRSSTAPASAARARVGSTRRRLP